MANSCTGNPSSGTSTNDAASIVSPAARKTEQQANSIPLSQQHVHSSQSSKMKGRPTPEEIEEKRRLRAEKKEREAREKEEQEKAGIVGATSNGKLPFVTRSWSPVTTRAAKESAGSEKRVRILSWNILAQGLVRRKLFPGSDCLKWKEREAGLTAELHSHNWDIAAFQEVDRIDTHGPNLNKAGKDYAYAKGYREKQHGLMIAWRRAQSKPGYAPEGRQTFAKVEEKVIYFDRECIGPAKHDSRDVARTGLSRVTRNIALFVALEQQTGLNESKSGILVATTHLFWHPMHAYERVRQTGILKRRLVEWRASHPSWHDWPIVLAGDFNDQPHSATYKLVSGAPLTQHCIDEVQQSTVVHKSVDELKEKMANEPREGVDKDDPLSELENTAATEAGEEGEQDIAEDEEGEDECGADDQMLKNCRAPTENDRLLTFAELFQLHDLSQDPPASDSSSESSRRSTSPTSAMIGRRTRLPLTSAYGSTYDALETSQEGNYFGSKERGRERHDDSDWEPGMPNVHTGPSKEPMYTLYSSLFALTLDYIFLFPSTRHMETMHHTNQDLDNTSAPSRFAAIPSITALLPTHRTDILEPGVPRRGVCASDHIAIGAELGL